MASASSRCRTRPSSHSHSHAPTPTPTPTPTHTPTHTHTHTPTHTPTPTPTHTHAHELGVFNPLIASQRPAIRPQLCRAQAAPEERPVSCARRWSPNLEDPARRAALSPSRHDHAEPQAVTGRARARCVARDNAAPPVSRRDNAAPPVAGRLASNQARGGLRHVNECALQEDAHQARASRGVVAQPRRYAKGIGRLERGQQDGGRGRSRRSGSCF